MAILPIELPQKENRRKITNGIYVERDGDRQCLIIGGARVLEFDRKDLFEKNLAISMVIELKCQKVDIARAFEVHRNTVTNVENNMRNLGIVGLVDGREGPLGPTKMTPKIKKQIVLMKKKGLGPTEIHRRLLSKNHKIGIASVYRCLAEIREEKEENVQEKPVKKIEELSLFPPEEDEIQETGEQVQARYPVCESGIEENSVEEVLLSNSEEVAAREDVIPDMASSEDKATQPENVSQNSEPVEVSPLFKPEQGKSISYAGAFLAWPYLSLLGLLPMVWQIYGELLKVNGRLYGLMQSISSFFFLTLLGFNNLESFKVVDREGFRRLIGAVSSPTVKTLRGKLGVISAFGKGYEFLMRLAKRYFVMGMLEVGVLYLDGHFIPYFGKREMGKGYYTLRRLAHPGRTQHFVNDRNGRPLFFLLREADESFVKMIPELIKETHALIGGQQLTFVFDRGGQSGTLFKEIESGGDLFITYKKGKYRSMPGGVFRSHKAVSIRWGKKFEKIYELWEGKIDIKKYGNARLILVKKNGHQTPVITNDWKRPAVEIVSLMFDRWSQENFFKYMRANYSIDELVTHKEQEIKTIQVPNPRWLELEKKIKASRKKIAVRERGVGKIVTKGEHKKLYDDGRKNPFTTKVAALKRMKTHLKKLLEEQKQHPKKISPSEIGQDASKVIPKEGKIILDTVKLAVYNAEEWLLEIMQPHYRDWRDPRTTLRMILRQKGNYQVKDGIVKVTLHRFENPSYQKAAHGMCETLTNLKAMSWDGKWKFEYEVEE